MFKMVICGLMMVFSSITFGQSSHDELVPGYCSPLSNNPLCWEGRDHTHNPRPTICLRKYSCNVVQNVKRDSWGHFHCKAVNGQTFSCDDLVKEFGRNLYGLVVKVSTPFVDGCHMSGACGPRACVPSYGSASLDQSCQ